MAEPSSAYTYDQLITLIAREAGCAYHGTTGQKIAMPPVTNNHDLVLMRGIVDRGIKLFQDLPPEPEGWLWRNKLMSVTMVPGQADPSTYVLDQDFDGTPASKIYYQADTNHSNEIRWVHESVIRSQRAVVTVTAYPLRAAIIPSSAGTERRWELLVDPEPPAADVLQFRYIAHYDNRQIEGGTATGGTAATLIDTTLATINSFADDYFNGWVITVLEGTGVGETATVTDWTKSSSTFDFTALSGGSTPDTTTVYMVQPASNYHPAGAAFDTAILHACYAQLEMEQPRISNGWQERFFNLTLPAAHVKNNQQKGRLRRLGKMSNGPKFQPERTWNDIGKIFEEWKSGLHNQALEADGASDGGCQHWYYKNKCVHCGKVFDG